MFLRSRVQIGALVSQWTLQRGPTTSISMSRFAFSVQKAKAECEPHSCCLSSGPVKWYT